MKKIERKIGQIRFQWMSPDNWQVEQQQLGFPNQIKNITHLNGNRNALKKLNLLFSASLVSVGFIFSLVVGISRDYFLLRSETG